mgnify:CR=1 FL=1
MEVGNAHGTSRPRQCRPPVSTRWVGIGVFTVAYAAPEQIQRELGPTGPWTDVYALGALLYFALTGNDPFPGRTSVEVIDKLVRTAPLPLRKHRPEIPDALERLVADHQAVPHRPVDKVDDEFQVDIGAEFPAVDAGLDDLPRGASTIPIPSVGVWVGLVCTFGDVISGSVTNSTQRSSA